MADKPACAARLTALKPVGIGMSCWSSKQSRPRQSRRLPCLPIALAGKSRSPRTTPASRPVGKSMNGATANWRTWPRICSCCWRCSMTVGSSVEKTSPPSKPKGAVEGFGEGGGTGGTTRQCEGSCGACSRTSVISLGSGHAKSSLAAPPTRAPIVANPLKPISHLLSTTGKKPSLGARGSIARPVAGMGRGITPPPSILPAWAWPF